VTTDPINISGATGSVSRTVRIHVPEGVGIAGSQRVQVNIKIE
jgi:YbbR domain-containing protein